MPANNVMAINSPSVIMNVGTSTSTVALPQSSSLLRIVNLGATAATIMTDGPSAIAVYGATVTIPPGAVEVVSKNYKDMTLAAITASGTTILSISCVEGL